MQKGLKVRLFKPGRTKQQTVDFTAWVNSLNMSVGGVYLESTFFLKKGLAVELEFSLPKIEEPIRVSGVVVHVVQEKQVRPANTPSGFAIRFTKFHGDADVYLRAFLARGDLYHFVASFVAKALPKLKEEDLPKLVEMIVRWEILQEALAE